MIAVLSPFPSKREGDGSLFCALTRCKFFLKLSMISWGQFYVMKRFCDFFKRHNLLIKIQKWLTFLWTTFCPCLVFTLSASVSMFLWSLILSLAFLMITSLTPPRTNFKHHLFIKFALKRIIFFLDKNFSSKNNRPTILFLCQILWHYCFYRSFINPFWKEFSAV